MSTKYLNVILPPLSMSTSSSSSICWLLVSCWNSETNIVFTHWLNVLLIAKFANICIPDMENIETRMLE